MNLEALNELIERIRKHRISYYYTILCSQENEELIKEIIKDIPQIAVAVFPKGYDDQGKVFLINHGERQVNFL